MEGAKTAHFCPLCGPTLLLHCEFTEDVRNISPPNKAVGKTKHFAHGRWNKTAKRVVEKRRRGIYEDMIFQGAHATRVLVSLKA